MPKGKHNNHSSGSSHHRWNGEIIVSAHGYRKIRVGRIHPLADPNGYAYEHLLIWVTAGNPIPATNEIIHHKNCDIQDNRLENLELMSRAQHNRLHNAERGRDEKGRFISKKAAGRLLDGREWNQILE